MISSWNSRKRDSSAWFLAYPIYAFKYDKYEACAIYDFAESTFDNLLFIHISCFRSSVQVHRRELLTTFSQQHDNYEKLKSTRKWWKVENK